LTEKIPSATTKQTASMEKAAVPCGRKLLQKKSIVKNLHYSVYQNQFRK
jgi:hypothetical protein